jgi:hypothetical protein
MEDFRQTPLIFVFAFRLSLLLPNIFSFRLLMPVDFSPFFGFTDSLRFDYCR